VSKNNMAEEIKGLKATLKSIETGNFDQNNSSIQQVKVQLRKMIAEREKKNGNR
jgi:hypothetical protein